MARNPRPSDVGARVRHLISLDASNVMKRLAARREEMISLFSRLRDRQPMLTTLQSWFVTVRFTELVELDLREQASVNAFHECLDEMRWYFTYTEDMPSTAQTTLLLMLKKLDLAYALLLTAVGPPAPPEGPTVVEVHVVAPPASRDREPTPVNAPKALPQRKKGKRK